MDADTDELLRLAFDRAPANLANQAITHVRDEVGAEGGRAVSYEVLLPDGNVRAFLVNTTLPRLINHLESLGMTLTGCGGLFLSVFHGDTLYFLHARDVLELLSRWSGLSFAELSRLHGPR